MTRVPAASEWLNREVGCDTGGALETGIVGSGHHACSLFLELGDLQGVVIVFRRGVPFYAVLLVYLGHSVLCRSAARTRDLVPGHWGEMLGRSNENGYS